MLAKSIFEFVVREIDVIGELVTHDNRLGVGVVDVDTDLKEATECLELHLTSPCRSRLHCITIGIERFYQKKNEEEERVRRREV